MRRLLKRIANALFPRTVHRRQIRILTDKEVEIGQLSKLVDPSKASIDIGANRGLYVHHLLKLTSKVIAFEPLPSMQQQLEKHYDGLIELHRVALSDHAGSAVIRMPSDNPSWATLASSNKLEMADADKGFVEHKVPLMRLDDFSFDQVGFIKIDVEGYEESVLRGAAATLRRERPTLLIEIEERHNKGSVMRIAQWLIELNYRVYFIDANRPVPFSQFNAARDQDIQNVGLTGKVGRYINNFIFVPNEKASAFENA
ncbi:FkbM family methyltransferase [Rhizobium sp. L43]|uniref:FkbM family methyltransferase n=1 Tax=Rhizobium sp. L43 TaxID=2035452 RepID=UPI0015CF0D9D|nr:FkbM family methyltransferase [Rhizobium sp. L43]